MAKMSEDELIALTDLEIRNSVGYFGGKMADQRRKATSYYLGLPEGDLTPPEVDGRSAVVDTFVRNTIEAMLPQLMVKFVGGDSVVEFEASAPGDEQKAKLCTDYLNYLFWKKNRGHVIAETWMRDALLYKNGIVKIWWDDRYDEKKEVYKGMTQFQLSELMDDEEIEVKEATSYPDPEDVKAREQAMQQAQQALQQPPQPMQPGQPDPHQAAMMQMQQIEQAPPVLLYDVTACRTKKGGKLAIENVPPEEFLISRKAKEIATASFVCHRVARTMSDLKSMGYKGLDDLGSDSEAAASFNAESLARNSFDNELAYVPTDNLTADESQRLLWVNECYVRCDWDGDGISELRKVTRVGNKLLDNEEVDIAPFADIVCIRQPHKFAGLSIADLGMETQKTKTGILRGQLDNMNLQVNGRYYAVENQVNLDDLLTSRPGGIVRIKTAGAVGRLDQAMGDAQAGMGMLEYMEGFGESATGWTRSSQGNDSAPLMSGTATAAKIVASRDDMRVDLIARNFAEGFVELFRQMLKLVCQHQSKKAEVRISGEWAEIDPREWRNQFDVNINVGLGVGGKEQQIQQMLAVIAQQEKVHAIGVASPENIYNSSVELAKLAGQKNGDKFFSDPAKQPPQPPKPDPEMVKGQVAMQLAQANGQVTMQVENAKLQAQMAMEQRKAELDAQVAISTQQAQQAQETTQQQLQAQLDTHKAALDAQVEQSRLQHEKEMEAFKQQAESQRKGAEIQAAADKAKLDNDTKILIAQITAQTAITTAAQSAQEGADEEVAKSNGKDMTTILASLKTSIDKMGGPRTIKRGPDGRAQGIE